MDRNNIQSSSLSPRALHRTWLAGLSILLSLSTGHAAVDIDQQPLTTRSVLAPNIVMMLDDSGSMQWAVMPDQPTGVGYRDDAARDDELIDAAINGVYYDPDIAYLPPYTATAQPDAVTPITTRYPNATFEAAWYDGFDPDTDPDDLINIATYKTPSRTGSSDCNFTHSDGPSAICGRTPRGSHTFKVTLSPRFEYANHTGCPDGFVGPVNGVCTVQEPIDEPPLCQGYGGYSNWRNECDAVDPRRFRPEPCGSEYTPYRNFGPLNSPGLTHNGNRDECDAPGFPGNEYPRCQGYDNYSRSGDECNRVDPPEFEPEACGSTLAPGASGNVNAPNLELRDDRCVSDSAVPNCPAEYQFSLDAGPNGEDCRKVIDEGGGTVYRSLFVYKDVNELNYVGAATASAGTGSSSSPLPGTCAEITSNTVQNVHTGVMFTDGIDDSLCHNNDAVRQNVANWFSYYRKRIYMAKSGLMNAFATLDPAVRLGFGSINGDSDGDNAGRLPDERTNGTPRIATVKPFGSGGSGTQKEAYWDWLSGAIASGSTPLRSSLKAAGDYYTTDQPWQSGMAENASSPSEELACRQSYSILMTDGYWNGDDDISFGNADAPVIIQERSGPNSKCFEYPHKSSGSTCESPVQPEPYVGSASDTLADVAMYYWLTDLRPDKTNEVPAGAEDPAFWQHMSTFTVGLFGQDASLPGLSVSAEEIAVWAETGGAPNNFDWPAPGSSSANNISDLVHAGINGRGGFYSAGNPKAFEEGLRDALRRVQDRVGTGASLAANSTRLDTGTTTYQSLYYSSNWRGDLKALPVNANTGAIENQNVDWLASEEMPDWDDRNITTCATCPNTPALVDLTWANISTAQKSALGTSQTEQTNVINWLRGQPNNESPNGAPALRRRQRPAESPDAGVLGDIVSSQPVFVGAPNPNLYSGKTFPGAGSYSSFASGQAGRDAQLWVAANDGMVHAFDIASGAETFAYLPNAVIFPHTVDGVAYRGIESLSNTNYGGGAIPHQYFNDGELTVADAYFDGGWKTVLVGTTGRGPARAVYALNVTDPDNPTLLWERAAGDGQANSDWIGQILGKPVIAMVGDPANPTWAVLMGNGYNSAQDRAALLQFDLGTGALSVHQTDSTGSNGLAQPVVWIGDPDNATGTVAYAGDLSGKLWSFSLGSGTTLGAHLFTTQDASGNPQPITAGMLAGKDPDTQKVWVFFGTGRFLEGNDLGNTGLQTWYGLIVQGNGAVTSSTLRASGLTQRDITGEIAPDPDADPPELGARTVEDSVAGDMAGKAGWFMDLKLTGSAGRGERMVTPNQFQGSLLLGTTRIPGTGSDKCNPSGDGWIMAINPFTGAAPSDIFFDLNGDGEFDEDDMIGDPPKPAAGVGFTSIPNNPIFVGNVMLVSFDNATNASIATAGGGGAPERMSWRELVDQ